ncbi:MAG: sialidase family protein [Verrucomicrobiae bacterium]|nr:sialidase family protein [Verrucomicrobiae bacterium]
MKTTEKKSAIQVRERRTGAPGKEIILGRSDESFPRHSEGDLAQLQDGSLLAVWSRFKGASDHSRSEIIGRRSLDMGMTWSEIEIIASLDEDAHRRNSNLMSASLLCLKNGSVLLVYSAKEEDLKNGRIVCYPYCRFIEDETRLSAPIPMADQEHYYVAHNARMIQTADGRLLLPASVAPKPVDNQECKVLISDDHGLHWKCQPACSLFNHPYGEALNPPNTRTLHEPSLFELSDGRMMMVMRTRLNHPFFSISADKGETWSSPEPIADVVNPESPQSLFRHPNTGKIIMTYNNNPLGKKAGWEDRRPLSFTISADEGATFKKGKDIESVEGYCWSYVSCRPYGDQVYLLYYEWPRSHVNFFFCDLKLSIVPLDWFK